MWSLLETEYLCLPFFPLLKIAIQPAELSWVLSSAQSSLILIVCFHIWSSLY